MQAQTAPWVGSCADGQLCRRSLPPEAGHPPEASQTGRHGGQRPQRSCAAADLRQHGKLGHADQPACTSSEGGACGRQQLSWPAVCGHATLMPGRPPQRRLTRHGGRTALAPQRQAQHLVRRSIEGPHVGRPVRVAQPPRKREETAEQLRGGGQAGRRASTSAVRTQRASHMNVQRLAGRGSRPPAWRSAERALPGPTCGSWPAAMKGPREAANTAATQPPSARKRSTACRPLQAGAQEELSR